MNETIEFILSQINFIQEQIMSFLLELSDTISPFEIYFKGKKVIRVHWQPLEGQYGPGSARILNPEEEQNHLPTRVRATDLLEAYHDVKCLQERINLYRQFKK